MVISHPTTVLVLRAGSSAWYAIAKWAKERPVCKASSPGNRKVAGSNPARSTTLMRLNYPELKLRGFVPVRLCIR